MNRLLRILAASIGVMFSAFSVHALEPSPAQIQAFKSMSPAEQSALAQQFGVKFPEQTSAPQIQVVQESSVKPRDVNNEVRASSVTNSENEGLNEKIHTSKPLPLFGYELFAGAPSTFAPIRDIPVSSDYILGVGDSLKVNLFGKESKFFELTIDEEGTVFIPDLGPVTLAGLSFSEAKQTINGIIDQKIIGVKASIAMGQLRSIRVFILGEAHKPGSYVMSSLSTVTNALLLSGGVSTKGSLRDIQIKRGGEIIQNFDLYDLLLKGDTRNDTLLQSGDVVFIPPVGTTVGIQGDVLRPAIYELKSGETVNSLLNMAGGMLATAHPNIAKLERITDGDEKVLMDLDLKSDQRNQSLKNGDLITVQPKLGLLNNYVSVNGPVFRPGNQTWQPGMTLGAALDYAGLQPDVDLNYAVLVRQLPNAQVDVRDLDLTQNATRMETLTALDSILLFSINDKSRTNNLEAVLSLLRAQASSSAPVREVSISGSVRFPGTYPLTSGMTVNDLIIAAGGFTEKAYLLTADLTRSEVNQNQTTHVVRQELNIRDAAALTLPLMSRDVVQIKAIPNWAEKATVELTGEVNFPGTYTIYKNDSLYDVIKRAGGLTEYAYIPAAVFTRKELREQQAQRVAEMKRKLTEDIAKAELIGGDSLGKEKEKETSSEVAEAQKLLTLLDQTPVIGRLVIDLERVLANSPEYRIPLQDGDRLHVPMLLNAVTVIGEVQQPISQIYQPELGLADYVARSGGTTLNADEERIYIVRASGDVVIPETSSWFSSQETEVAPGDTVVVPLHPEKVDQVVLWKDLSQIMYQIGLGAAAVGSL